VKSKKDNAQIATEIKMLSWQGRLLKIYLRIQRFFHPPTGELDVEKKRAKLEATGKRFKPTFSFQSTALVADSVSAEWIVPSAAYNDRVILYLHGGAYNRGSINSHRLLAANIANAAQARALIIDYRLAPEDPFPAAIEDAMTAYQWLLSNNISPDQIVVVGDSAGGGLTLSMLVALRDEGEPLSLAAVCLSPWTDLTITGESWSTKAKVELVLDPGEVIKSAQLYLKNAGSSTPLASPVYADLSNLPPLLIQVGTDEILLSDSTRLAEKAKAAGVDVNLEVWEGMFHVWHFAANILPEGRQAIDRIGQFIDQMFKRSIGRNSR
jgi:acetyl esterase/lipase